jgi:hypothetical protein
MYSSRIFDASDWYVAMSLRLLLGLTSPSSTARAKLIQNLNLLIYVNLINYIIINFKN